MKNKTKKSLKLLLFAIIILVGGAYVVFLLLISSPPKNWEAIQGNVLDAQTNESIEDAWVIYHWKGNSTALVASAVVCYHVESAQTDSNGRFVIPAWNESLQNSRHIYLTDKSRWYKVIFKPGYRESSRTSKEDSYRQHRYYLEKYEAKTREDELWYLLRVIRQSQCGSPHNMRIAIQEMIVSIYLHATQIAKTTEEQEIIDEMEVTIVGFLDETDNHPSEESVKKFYKKYTEELSQ